MSGTEADPAVDVSRLEAFSDGVIAIAVTLLVLDIRVPAPGGGSLGHALAQQWPNYAAYTVSFLTIGIIWINHRACVARLRRLDHSVMVLNLLLLLSIGVLPFSTALMAAYIRNPEGQHLAAAVYAGSFLVLGCMFYALNVYVLGPRTAHLRRGLSDEARRRLIRYNGLGLIPYVIATAIAPVSAYATLVLCAAVAVFYGLPQR